MAKNLVSVLACSVLLAASQVVVAAKAPAFSEADQWRRDLRSAVDAGQAALRDRAQHPKHAQRLALLVKRAERLFGDVLSEPFGACIKASSLIEAAWQDESAALTRVDAVRVGGIATQSFEAGAHYWACRLAIDELESKKP